MSRGAGRGRSPRLPPGTLLLKVQRPLDMPSAPWLVYDELRSINQFIPANEIPSSVSRAMGAQSRMFFYVVRQDDDGRLIFGSPAPDPGW